MEGILLFLLGLALFFSLVYYAVRAAVRDGIRLAVQLPPKEADKISQTICGCGQRFDMDLPRCPNCKRENIFLKEEK